MIRIDLGKEELKKEPTSPKSVVTQLQVLELNGRGIALLVTAFALSVVPYLFVEKYKDAVRRAHERRVAELNAKKEELRQDIARFKTYKAEVDSYEQQKRLIHERLSAVERLVSHRNSAVSILDAIGQSMVPNSWLTSMEIPFNQGSKIMLSGFAHTNEEVSDVVDRLSQSIHLTDVTLDSVMSDLQKDRANRTFQISAQPKGLFLNDPAGRQAASTPGSPNPAANVSSAPNKPTTGKTTEAGQ